MWSPHVVHLSVVGKIWLWFFVAFEALGVFVCFERVVLREEIDLLLDGCCGTGVIESIEGKIFL